MKKKVDKNNPFTSCGFVPRVIDEWECWKDIFRIVQMEESAFVLERKETDAMGDVSWRSVDSQKESFYEDILLNRIADLKAIVEKL